MEKYLSKEKRIDYWLREPESTKKMTATRVESVYLSESGDELKVTMYPYGVDSKFVYFMDLDNTQLIQESTSQNMRIVDGNNDLRVVIDSELQPTKVSEGLQILTGGNEMQKQKWLRNQLSQVDN